MQVFYMLKMENSRFFAGVCMTKSLSMIDLYGNEDPEEDKKEEEEDDTDFKDPTKNGLLLAVVKTLRQ